MSLFTRCLAGTALIILAACSKKETYPTASLGTYYPLAVGKYIIYRMDSLVFVNSGQTMQIHSYLAKDTVDGIQYDNLGRTTYVVHRFLTDTLFANPWQVDITYTVTPTTNTMELVENNLRFIKLTEPFTTNLVWSGNSYLGDNPYQTYYGNFMSQSALQFWQFSYQNIGQPDTIGNNLFTNTITVFQDSDSTNLPVLTDSAFASKGYGLEVYASGVGLIYKSYIAWDYQPVTADLPGFYEGFGVTQYILSHN